VGRGVPDAVSDVASPGRLAFKAREIEELADVFFFRPFGMIFAVAARSLRLTPTMVTLAGTAVGILGGVLLAWPQRAFLGFLVIIAHSVLDSSDGQLARMTGQSSEFGRMMDGLGGYATHLAIYGGIIASAIQSAPPLPIVALALAAGVANVVHAQMYDYHRQTYIAIAIKGQATDPLPDVPVSGLVGRYEAMQRQIAGLHPRVEQAAADRAANGSIRDVDRALYRRCFYWPVRGWNAMGDNTRFYAIGLFAWLGHVEWFLLFELVPMNAAWIGLWLWQRRADRHFLEAL
jgi:phosphatidylglycerophosphate synthase